MRTAKKAALIGAAALTTAGVIGGLAIPANAEPSAPNPTSEAQELALVGVGSDTIQDLLTGLSTVVTDQWTGSPVIASYDAVQPGTNTPSLIKPRVNGDQFLRPNGSGAGLSALRAAVDPHNKWNTDTAATGGATAPLDGSDIQFARSSDFTSSIVAGGKYAQIPIAVDAVTYATAATSNVPAGIPLGATKDPASTNPASPVALTLKNIYGGDGYLSSTIGGTTYKFYSGDGNPSDSSYTKLNVYAPQAGSGTRKFWFTTLEGNDGSTLPLGVKDTFGSGNQIVEEHDGSALQGDPNAIAPFSIAQWLAQSKATALNGSYGINILDRRHGAKLNAIGSVNPTTGGTAPELNTAFPVSRPVFIRVEYSQLKVNPYLRAAFVSDDNHSLNSDIYDATNPITGASTIEDFGFATIPNDGFTTPTIAGQTFFRGDADDYRFN